MDLKRDSHGRPIGLQWPDRPPISEEVIKKHLEPRRPTKRGPRKTANTVYDRKYGRNRILKERCDKHDLDLTNPENISSNGNCIECHRANNRAYKARKKAESEAKS